MIEIQNETSHYPEINQEMIQFAVSKTLSLHEKPSADVTIRFTDDAEIRKLNRTFRSVDTATDVLSFNQDILNPETGRLYLGDIVISLERVFQQAVEHNHSFNQECVLLAIHGTLHLLGYVHAEQDEKEKMWKMQSKIMKNVRDEFQELSG